MSAGLGDLRVSDELKSNFTLPVDEMSLIPAIALDDIVSRLRDSVFNDG